MKNGELIEKLVVESTKHPTAEQIYLQAKEIAPNIVMATVYNNLNRLVEEGKLRRIQVAGGGVRYDKPTRHEHIICMRCGAIKDVAIGDMLPFLRDKTGEEILDYELIFHYLCPACRG